MTNEASKREAAIKACFQQEQPPRQIHEAVLNACMYLPDRPKKRAFARGWRVALASLAMVVAMFGGLCGLNSFNPAFAESLPLVGNIFRMHNSGSKKTVGTYVGTYGKVEEVSAPAQAADTQELDLTAQEAYSDGEFVHLAFSMEAPEEYAGKFYYMSMPITATVDGKEAAPYSYLCLWEEDGRFVGAVSLQLAELAENGQQLNLQYETGEIQAYYNDWEAEAYEDLPGSFTGSLQVTADTTDNRILDGFKSSEGDVKILNIDATPSRTTITYEIPYWGEKGWYTDYPQLFTEDETWIKRSSKDDISDYDVYQADTITPTWSFDGLPAGTDKIILRFFNTDPNNTLYFRAHPEETPPDLFEPWVESWRQDGAPIKCGVLREVTIDLDTLEVTPTETYRDAGIPTCYDHFTDYIHLVWDIGFDDYFLRHDVHNASYDMIFADESLFQNGYALAAMDYAKESQSFTLQLFSTRDDSKDLNVVITGEDGKTVAEGHTVSSSKQEMESPGQYQYGMLVKSMIGREPELMDHMTVTLSDPDTGETLYETTIRLTRTDWRDGLYE